MCVNYFSALASPSVGPVTSLQQSSPYYNRPRKEEHKPLHCETVTEIFHKWKLTVAQGISSDGFQSGVQAGSSWHYHLPRVIKPFSSSGHRERNGRNQNTFMADLSQERAEPEI